MVRPILGLIALIATVVCTQPASAGPYADDLAKCFVQSSTSHDKTVFVQWLFAEISLHPSLQSMSSVTDQQRNSITKEASDYYQRLMFKDCRQQTVAALKYEGVTALLLGFRALGGAAMREMMSNPKTRAGLAAFNTSLDKQKMAELLKDAGLPVPAASTQPTK